MKHFSIEELCRSTTATGRGIGIQAGYGYDFGTKKLAPYVGLGIQYSLFYM